MRRRGLILRCGLSPGDIIMLTAAVRDLHLCHPGRFLTDTRTSAAELWEHNPRITALAENDRGVEQVECSYPLINRCNRTPYHCLHGFVEFLADYLGLPIRPGAFKGDIHLSRQEKAWHSQVHEYTRRDIPFWIVAAGGKYDVTIKWWETARYQAVIDHFRGRIQFVQVGHWGHYHPPLRGVIDLRGRTSLRELIRLMYHAEGVLCSVTASMHLAAAVETRPDRPWPRPCVVVAGAREPAHWEAYPGHQFIHTNGAFACAAEGGCWKDRVVPLRDGDERDQPEQRCVRIESNLPGCMAMITPDEVIRRIETYFAGGVARYLGSGQRRAARRGVAAARANHYDEQPLHLSSAGLALDRFVEGLNTRAVPPSRGRGIVICAGGQRYFPSAWVCINLLRRWGCRLPVQLWHLGAEEMPTKLKRLVEPLGVECVDALQLRRRFSVRILKGWELKAYALLHAPFREVLLLDADNAPVANPEYLFDTPQFRQSGAVFWPDYDVGRSLLAEAIWRSCGLTPPREPEFESGQILIDRQRCHAALRLAMWFNEHSDFYYRYLHGDKETFHLAFCRLRQPYHLIPTPVQGLAATICQHDFDGRVIFQHRNFDKWRLSGRNRRIRGFRFEAECFEYLKELRQRWQR